MKNQKKIIITLLTCIFSLLLISCDNETISLNKPITKKTTDYNLTIIFKPIEIKDIEYISSPLSSSSSNEIETQSMYIIPIEVTNNLETKKTTFIDTTINDFLYPNAKKITNTEIYIRDMDSGEIVGETSNSIQYENINDGTALSHTKIDLKSKETKTFYLPLIMTQEKTDLSRLEIVYKDSKDNTYIPIS